MRLGVRRLDAALNLGLGKGQRRVEPTHSKAPSVFSCKVVIREPTLTTHLRRPVAKRYNLRRPEATICVTSIGLRKVESAGNQEASDYAKAYASLRMHGLHTVSGAG